MKIILFNADSICYLHFLSILVSNNIGTYIVLWAPFSWGTRWLGLVVMLDLACRAPPSILANILSVGGASPGGLSSSSVMTLIGTPLSTNSRFARSAGEDDLAGDWPIFPNLRFGVVRFQVKIQISSLLLPLLLLLLLLTDDNDRQRTDNKNHRNDR